MTDITNFLLARVAEDEAAAKADDRHWSEVPYEVFSSNRIRAEVAAKRRIIELHGAELIEVINADGDERSGYWCTECEDEEFPCQTLRLLALPYGERPDYKQEWTP